MALFEKIVGETDSLQASFKQHLDQVLIPGALLRRRYYSIVRMALSGGISVEEQAFLNKMAAEWKIPPEEAAKIAKAVETAKTDFILMDSGDPSRDQVTFRDEIKCAWADGEIQPVEKQILSSLLKTVNLSPKELDNMIAAEAPPSVGKKS